MTPSGLGHFQRPNDNAQQFEGLREIHLENWDTELGQLAIGTFDPQVRTNANANASALLVAVPKAYATLTVSLCARSFIISLARQGLIEFGANVGPRGIRWQDGMSGEVIASGIITADMSGSDFGWLQINIGEDFQQCVQLIFDASPFRRRAVVFYVFGAESTGDSPLETARSTVFPVPPVLGPTGRLPLSIRQCYRPGTHG